MTVASTAGKVENWNAIIQKLQHAAKNENIHLSIRSALAELSETLRRAHLCIA
jgi:hypothetical protein